MGGKRRGCQGGTVCGSLGSGLLPKIVYVCLHVCFHSAYSRSASALLSQIWWHLCQTKLHLGNLGGKVWKLGSIQNFHSPLNAAIPKLCVQPTATVGKTGLELTFSAVFSFLRAFLCTLPAEHDQAFDLLCILPLDSCKAQAAFKAQQ